MGAEESVPIPPPPPSAYPDQPYSPYFIFSLYGCTIHMVYAPSDVIRTIVSTIETHSICGIQYHKPKLEHAYKIVLNEYFFSLNTDSETALRSRFLMARILSALGVKGWLPVVSSDLRRMGDCANVLMQYNPQRRLTPSQQILVVGISGFDKLKVMTHHRPILQAVKDAVEANLSIQDYSEDSIRGIPFAKIKINMTPWGNVSEGLSVAARDAIASIIENMRKLDLHLLINFNTKPSADTYFFRTANPEELSGETETLHGIVTLGLNANDQLRVISRRQNEAFARVVEMLRSVIKKHWHRGLQDEWFTRQHHNFKMKGNPWWTDGNETVESRVLICKILEAMLALGWRLVCATDISRKLQDKSTFIFKNVRAPVVVNVPCLSFNETNKIRAINMTGPCINAVKETIQNQWLVTRYQQYGRSMEWKLNGSVWDYTPYYGKALVVHLLVTMNRMSYALLTSADVSSKYVHRENSPDYPVDVHSWFFVPVEVLTTTTTQLATPAPNYLSLSRNPSPFQSLATSPVESPVGTPLSSSRGSPINSPGFSRPSAPYYDPGHSDFVALPGGPVPEINYELSDTPPPEIPPPETPPPETPPPSYNEVVQNRWV